MKAPAVKAAQNQFEEIVCRIRRIACYRFRYLDPESREEAIQETTALAWKNYLRCRLRGKNPGASALTHYAVLNVMNGKGICGQNSTDVMSARTQRLGRTRVLTMNRVPCSGLSRPDSWDFSEALADRRTWTRPMERTRVKLDYRAFVAQGYVTRRESQVFRLLSMGFRTSEIAGRLGVSDPRVCQLKDALARKLTRFFGPGISSPSSRKPIRASLVMV